MPNSRFALHGKRPSLIHGLCALLAFNLRFMGISQAPLDTCLGSPFFASLSVHGLHFTVDAPSSFSFFPRVCVASKRWFELWSGKQIPALQFNLNLASVIPLLYLSLTSFLPHCNPSSAGNLEPRFGNHGLRALELVINFSHRSHAEVELLLQLLSCKSGVALEQETFSRLQRPDPKRPLAPSPLDLGEAQEFRHCTRVSGSQG